MLRWDRWQGDNVGGDSAPVTRPWSSQGHRIQGTHISGPVTTPPNQPLILPSRVQRNFVTSTLAKIKLPLSVCRTYILTRIPTPVKHQHGQCKQMRNGNRDQDNVNMFMNTSVLRCVSFNDRNESVVMIQHSAQFHLGPILTASCECCRDDASTSSSLHLTIQHVVTMAVMDLLLMLMTFWIMMMDMDTSYHSLYSIRYTVKEHVKAVPLNLVN